MDNLATINQSSRCITQDIYNTEKFADIDKKDREAIDMDTYNQQIYKEQMIRAKENNDLIQKEISEAKINLNASREKAKEREAKERAMQDDLAWNGLKNDWYWGSYSNDITKTSFSPLDNYLDKMKPESYLPIKLSKGYQVIGQFDEYTVPTAAETTKTFVYQSPFRDYLYDIKYDRLLPANSVNNHQKETDATSSPTVDPQEQVNHAFNTKLLLKNTETIPSSTPSPSTSPITEGFTSDVDPKLYEIYQKTLPPNPPKENFSYDVDYTYNYLYVLIISIILFLLFKST